MSVALQNIVSVFENSANLLFAESSRRFKTPAKQPRPLFEPPKLNDTLPFSVATNLSHCAVLQLAMPYFLSHLYQNDIISDVDIAIQAQTTEFEVNTRDIQRCEVPLFDDAMCFSAGVQFQDMAYHNIERAKSFHQTCKNIAGPKGLAVQRSNIFTTAQNLLTHVYNSHDEEALYVCEHLAMYHVAHALHAQFHTPAAAALHSAVISSGFEALEDFFRFHDFGSLLTDGDIVLPHDAHSQKVGQWAQRLFVPPQSDPPTAPFFLNPPGLN